MYLMYALLIALLQGGGAPPPPATDILKADLDATLKELKATSNTDIPIRTVDAGGHNVGVGLVHRPKGKPLGSASHDKVTEVYHMLEGSGMLVTGGTMTRPQRRDGPPYTPAEIARYRSISGPGTSGAAIEGGVSRRIQQGDVVIIPAGTPHWWSEVTEDMTYTVVRVDPSRVVPVK